MPTENHKKRQAPGLAPAVWLVIYFYAVKLPITFVSSNDV